MALNETTKTSIAFKKLITKDHRNPDNKWYEETDGGGVNVHSDDVWQEAIPGTPPGSTTSVVKCYVDGADGALKLVEDVSIPSERGWYADDSGQLRGFIPPKYGQGYTVKLYEDNGSGTAKGSQIFTTDAMDWFFDYDTGFLAIQDSHSYTTPFWIEAYYYVGNKKGVQSIAKSGDSALTGDVTLSEGSNVTLTQVGNDISIAASGGGGGGASRFRWTANGYFQVDTDVDGAWISDAAFTISGVWIWRGSAGTSSSTIVDIHKNGTTLYTTQANRPEIDWNDGDKKVDCTLPDVTSIAAGDIITIDIDQIEAGDPSDLIVVIEGS